MQVLGTLNNLERILDKTFQECVIQPILYDSINELFKRGGDHAWRGVGNVKSYFKCCQKKGWWDQPRPTFKENTLFK
jgi:hypothetical protein